MSDLHDIREKINAIHEAIYGNGDTSQSMLARQIRVEENLMDVVEHDQIAARNLSDVTKALAEVTTTVKDLKTTVTGHSLLPHLHNLVRNRWFWIAIVISTMIAHGLLAAIGDWKAILNWVLALLHFPPIP